MKAGFYPKMAVGGMCKNGRLYVPYMLTCILMVAMFYILHFWRIRSLLYLLSFSRWILDNQ